MQQFPWAESWLNNSISFPCLIPPSPAAALPASLLQHPLSRFPLGKSTFGGGCPHKASLMLFVPFPAMTLRSPTPGPSLWHAFFLLLPNLCPANDFASPKFLVASHTDVQAANSQQPSLRKGHGGKRRSQGEHGRAQPGLQLAALPGDTYAHSQCLTGWDHSQFHRWDVLSKAL